MNRNQIILYHRTRRAIKGHKPTILYLSRQSMPDYRFGPGDFILSIDKNHLYFQRLTFFTKKMLPKKDFQLRIDEISLYSLYHKNIAVRILTFYTKDKNFVSFNYFTGTADTYDCEQNIKTILKELEARGVKREAGSDK